MGVDFLPVCDLLFNFVSVVTYFCDLAFDVLILKEAYDASDTSTLVPLLSAMIISLFLCQILSFGWYIEDHPGLKHTTTKDVGVLAVHILQCGVLWRYTKLLIKPLALTNVKCEMRNLCVLRLIHGMCQSVYFLLIQSHLVFKGSTSQDVHYVSIAFSLFNVCWALASFNKNISRENVEKLVLTWIGVVFQLVWRLGTVSARIISLTVYWSAYGYWVLCVLVLHWLCVFMTFVIPNKLFKRDVSYCQWVMKSLVVSYIYIFSYLNLDKANIKLRMALYYVVTMAENLLLVSLWSVSLTASIHHSYEDRVRVFLAVCLPFVGGMIFMLLYYRYFHATKLGNVESLELTSKPRAQNNPNTDISAHPHAVFNCVLPTTATKKKKMPSILPPPPVMPRSTETSPPGKAKTPFWKEPLPVQNGGLSSDSSQQQIYANEPECKHYKP